MHLMLAALTTIIYLYKPYYLLDILLFIDCNEEYAQKVVARLNNEISSIHSLLSMA